MQYIDIIIQTALVAGVVVNLIIALTHTIFEKRIEAYLLCTIIMLALITGKL